MLHTKVHGNQSTGSEEDFWKIFTIYGDHLGHVTSIILILFISLYLKAYIQNLVKDSQVIALKRKFEF